MVIFGCAAIWLLDHAKNGAGGDMSPDCLMNPRGSSRAPTWSSVGPDPRNLLVYLLLDSGSLELLGEASVDRRRPFYSALIANVCPNEEGVCYWRNN